MPQPSSTDETSTAPAHRWRAVVEIVLIFAVFFLHGAWPTPDVNENGYLVKAQHFWNPQAFHNDFFCNTADAHAVYYWAFGWITNLGWSLATAAWIGRGVTWFLLAIVWRKLSFTVLPKAWWAVLSAEFFVLLNEQAQMAGEWVIGGVEAKGFAYVLVLLALTFLVRGKWNWIWPLAGAATSLHAVVGGWSILAFAGVWCLSAESRPKFQLMLPGLALGFALALPGLYYIGQMN
ncbi:MAG TPA: hypothetical protein VGJ15_04490, partial [Pirellulales bacterium]